METPTVSVVIPTFNRAFLLEEALRSVFAQTYDDYEIIVVDDGSTDNTCEVVARFACPKLHYIHQENSGRSSARNRAIALSKGKYIAFLDSDDLFAPDKLLRQVSLLDKLHEYGMVYTAARVIDDQGTEIFSPFAAGERVPYYQATESGWIHDKIAFYLPVTILLPTVMVRSSLIEAVGVFDENLDRFEDTDMWRRISMVTKIYALNEPLSIIRTHAGNVMEHPQKVFGSIRYYLEKIRNEGDLDSLQWRQGGGRLYLHYGLAIKSLYECDIAGRFFSESIKLFPSSAIDYLLVNRVLGVRYSLHLAIRTFLYAPSLISRFLFVTVARFICQQGRRLLNVSPD